MAYRVIEQTIEMEVRLGYPIRGEPIVLAIGMYNRSDPRNMGLNEMEQVLEAMLKVVRKGLGRNNVSAG